jgi:hypothetical protein
LIKRRMRWPGHVARMGARSGVYWVLMGENWEKKTIWKTQE